MTERFEAVGYETDLYLLNAQDGILLMSVQLSLFVLIPIACVLKRCCKNWYIRCREYFIFNGTLRIFIEIYLNNVLFSILNIRGIYDRNLLLTESEIGSLSNVLSIFIFTSCVIVPVTVLIYSCKYTDE